MEKQHNNLDRRFTRHDGLNKCEHGTALHSALDIQSVSLHEPIGQAIMAYRQNYSV